jgi:hypothetical protein
MGVIVAEVLTACATKSQMRRRTSRPVNLAVAMGYAPWVEEIWVNYFSNAIKYGGQPEKAFRHGWSWAPRRRPHP